MNKEQYYIEKCRSLIEQKLGWGDSQDWQNQHFETLSTQILEETNVSLSNSTLKRIWGKVKYESSPNLATLNALAQYIGHVNWQHFTKTIQTENIEIVHENGSETEGTISKNILFTNKKWLVAAIFGSLLLYAGIHWAFKIKTKELVFKNLEFSSKPVTKGIPNTVIFSYNAKDSNADSVFIQQNWDARRRHKVDKNKNTFTGTYYIPGYFRAKLVLNDSIVKQHGLFVESDDWMATIDYEPIPTYVEKSKFMKGNIMSLGKAEIPKYEEFTKQKLWTSFHKVSKAMTVPSENFKMEAELRSTYAEAEGICQKAGILLIGTKSIIFIPLSIKGCVGELNLSIGNNSEISGLTADLSAFGVDFQQFVNVKCAVKNKRITILINDKPAYQGSFHNNIGDIVGTRIRFKGTGEVKKFEIGRN